MASPRSVPLWSRLPSSLAASLWATMRRLAGRPKATIGALGIFFAVAIALLFLADLRARYRAEIDQARHSAENYAEVLAQQTALTFEAIDRSLRQAELIRADLEAALAMPGADEVALHRRAGDALLREIADRLKKALRETDLVARLGGDEFAIIQAGEADQRGAAVELAKRIIALTSAPYDLHGNMVSIGTSIGIAMAREPGVESDTLMKQADLALYRTKSEGRNGYCFFDERMTADADARRQLEADLRDAIAGGQIEIHYQPILHVKTRKLFRLEALARWRHPVKGFVPPSEFIPLAEETGLIVPLGEWVLHKACETAKRWPHGVKVAVNISAVQFAKSDLLDVVTRTLAETRLPPERLELEITETALLEKEAGVLATLQQLERLGIAISLDDFGTGYSSLRYLTTFPIDKIKIDKSFTQNITHRADCAAVVASVLALGSGLDVATVAEGVETKQQFDILRASGVNYVQRYLFGAPFPAEEIDFTRFEENRRLDSVA